MPRLPVWSGGNLSVTSAPICSTTAVSGPSAPFTSVLRPIGKPPSRIPTSTVTAVSSTGPSAMCVGTRIWRPPLPVK